MLGIKDVKFVITGTTLYRFILGSSRFAETNIYVCPNHIRFEVADHNDF